MIDNIAYQLITKKNQTLEPIILGITGHIGTGKTYIMTKLVEYFQNEGYSVIIDSVASDLKKLIQNLLLLLKNQQSIEEPYPFVDDKLLHDPHIKSIVEKCSNDWRCTIQKIGEYVRQSYDYDYWISKLYDRILRYKTTPVDFIIIPDIRYFNEDQYLRNAFKTYYLIKVVRSLDKILESTNMSKEEYHKALQHESEKYIDELNPDFIIENN